MKTEEMKSDEDDTEGLWWVGVLMSLGASFGKAGGGASLPLLPSIIIILLTGIESPPRSYLSHPNTPSTQTTHELHQTTQLPTRLRVCLLYLTDVSNVNCTFERWKA